MTVYVDNYNADHGRMVMCHMVADTQKELHEMASKIGVDRKWFQRRLSMPWRDHYDICLAKKKLAVRYGAIEITVSQLGKLLREKKREAKEKHDI